MAAPPPNLPTPPSSSGTDSIRRPLTGGMPGGGVDAPDPFGGKPITPPAPMAAMPGGGVMTPPTPPKPAMTRPAPPAPEPSPLAPPAFRQPRSQARGRRTVVLALSGLIVIVLLGVVGFVAFRLLFAGAGNTEEPTPTPSALTSVPPTGEQQPTTAPSNAPQTSVDASAQVADPDADGLTNAEEAFYRTDPAKPDTDGDGFSDSQEVRAGYDPLGPGKLDSDNDGFPDPDEREFGSDPFNPDTDGDGFNDGAEIKNGFNPLIPSPGDKL